MSKARFTACGVILALVASGAWAGSMYRWVDAAGTVHFSGSPPSRAGYTTVDPRVAPPTSAPGVVGITEFSKRYDADAAKRKQERQARLALDARREALCAKARRRIAGLESATARRLYVPQPDGSRARMTEPEFEKRVNAARAVASANCGS